MTPKKVAPMKTRYVYFAHAGAPTEIVKIGISIRLTGRWPWTYAPVIR